MNRAVSELSAETIVVRVWHDDEATCGAWLASTDAAEAIGETRCEAIHRVLCETPSRIPSEYWSDERARLLWNAAAWPSREGV
jgi:hypothetical protein